MIGSEGERELQKKYNTASRANSFYKNQVLTYLNENMISFIKRMELCFIATSDSKGGCDSSLRSGEPNFCLVLDDTSVIYPEYRGNGVLASLGNISENPNIGMLFLDFTSDKIGLHINGKAEIIDNEDLDIFISEDQQKAFEREQSRAVRWVKVTIEEAYIHCSKHIPVMQKVDMSLPWGTDDMKLKGGDYFKSKNCSQTK
ncbi:MAG: pyridoxamine 5'-phosphate oxidase family protein [Lentisphaeraceae bacterium]|nr:pyridoxamine 5'-phosphate oxidase family protein [Lentisphaeraceae bacterium]